jgi:hypothetical protein
VELNFRRFSSCTLIRPCIETAPREHPTSEPILQLEYGILQIKADVNDGYTDLKSLDCKSPDITVRLVYSGA